MATTYVETSAILQRLGDMLSANTATWSESLTGIWTRHAEAGNQSAFQIILRKLLARGYTREQIDIWDERAIFNLDIATYWALRLGSTLHGITDDQVAAFNRATELDKVELIASDSIETVDEDAVSGRVAKSGDLDLSDAAIDPSDGW